MVKEKEKGAGYKKKTETKMQKVKLIERKDKEVQKERQLKNTKIRMSTNTKIQKEKENGAGYKKENRNQNVKGEVSREKIQGSTKGKATEKYKKRGMRKNAQIEIQTCELIKTLGITI